MKFPYQFYLYIIAADSFLGCTFQSIYIKSLTLSIYKVVLCIFFNGVKKLFKWPYIFPLPQHVQILHDLFVNASTTLVT